MKLRDIVDAYGAQISAGFERGSYAAFAPAEETVGFIATDGSGARGIAFMCDRLRTDLDGTIRQAEYAGITGLELLDSGEGAYADELVIKTGGEPIRISDYSLEKHRLKALIEELRRAALAMSDNEREAVYSEAMLAAAEHFSQTAPVFAALPEIEKREAVIPDGYTPAQITEERIDWISGPRVRESEKAQEGGAAVAAKPVGAAEAELQPVGAPETAAQPVSAPEIAAKPASAPEAAAQPISAPEAAAQPVSVPETAANPAGVPETAAKPESAPEAAAQPVNAAQEAAPTAREVVREIAREMEQAPLEIPQEEAPAEPPVIPEYFVEEQEDLSEMTHEQTLSYLLSSINEINAPASAEPPAQQPAYSAPIQQAQVYAQPVQEQVQAAAQAVVQQEQAAPAQPLLTQEPVSGDIYIKASRKLREFCELGTLTQQGIEAAVKEGLIPAAEAFSQITAQKPAPPPLSERIAELKAASDRIDEYFELGEDVAARVMFFMLYQMLSYSDRLAELPETKARLNDFFRRWGAAGITLSMLDMRVQ